MLCEVSGCSEPRPYWLKRWNSVGARKAVPAEAVMRHCGVMEKP